MQKKLSRQLTPQIKLNNKDIPAGLVYFTGNAIASWSDLPGSFTTNLEDCTWHEDVSSGTMLYIVTEIKT